MAHAAEQPQSDERRLRAVTDARKKTPGTEKINRAELLERQKLLLLRKRLIDEELEEIDNIILGTSETHTSDVRLVDKGVEGFELRPAMVRDIAQNPRFVIEDYENRIDMYRDQQRLLTGMLERTYEPPRSASDPGEFITDESIHRKYDALEAEIQTMLRRLKELKEEPKQASELAA